MTKFYTGQGDRGDTTRLADDVRVPKSSELIEAIGTADEATCAIGVARAATQTPQLGQALVIVQRHLYTLMAHLSATPDARAQYAGLSEDDVSWLEDLIAEFEQDLPHLKDFVLPGESVTGAAFHMARAVVRRAERKLVALSEREQNIGTSNLAYLNRLSSLMFVAALYEDNAIGREPPLARGTTDK